METKTTAPVTPKAAEASPSPIKSFLSGIIIVLIIIIAVLLYNFVLGSPSNFEGGDTSHHPVAEGAAHWLGTVYKGGPIVPILMSFFLMVITFSIERFIMISAATGSGSVANFVRSIKQKLATGNVNAAIAECDRQKGSVGNVLKAVLNKYNDVFNEDGMTKDQKVLALQKELEDSTSLELPMLEKNLTIIATLASVATLTGLLGTVIGMIKAFAALAQAGAPDAAALSNGISEALINTALGIGTSAFAIIFYNYFTSKIDELTYSIDEAGFSIQQSFSARVK
ncbi:MAG: MotA/TolQ/ExbB proton channel family protein [Bacteroidota bacterium]